MKAGESATTRDNRRRQTGSLLAIVARQLRQRFDERVDQIGVTRARWTLIGAIARHPGATQRAIASVLGVTEVTAGRLIDRVCADGYLERRENPQDRRAYCLYLTPAAQPVIEQMARVAEAYEEEIFGSLAEEDMARLLAILEELSANLARAQKTQSATRAQQHADKALADLA